MCFSRLLKFSVTFIFALIISMQSFSAEQERYLHYTEVDGLPRNITTCLEQDQYGYLWIGTSSGIARFDGKNFYCYKELMGVGVIDLLYDSNNTLWVATGEGLFKYNRLTNYFDRFIQGFVSKIEEDKDNGDVYFLMLSTICRVSGDTVLNIYKGKDISDFCYSKEGFWVGESSEGAQLLSRESGFTQITASYLKNKSISFIRKIDDKLFVGCYNGQLYSIGSDRMPRSIPIDNHYFLEELIKVNQEFWLATDGYGIIVLDKDLKTSRILNRSRNTDLSINSNSIYDVLLGSGGELWLASYGAGLTCILPDNLLFQNLLPEKGNENSLVANEGVSVFVKRPFVYFGTNYGLSTWNEAENKFNNLTSDKLRKDLNGTKVTAIALSTDNNIWIGTYDGLLGKYDSKYNLIKAYHPSSNGPDDMQQIVQLQEIDRNNLLILTQFQSRILLNFNTQTETTTLFELYSKGSNITYFLLNSLRENQKGELLATLSDKGLFHVNWIDNVLENRLAELNKRIDFYVADFYQDKKGFYWFASSANGLICISEDGKNYKKFTVKEGLPSNTLVRIESVDDRFLWISTISGIFRFDMESGEALCFNHRDGLPANEFLDRISAKTPDGRIIFGSMAGFTIINPSKVNTEALRTEVVISDITFQNQSIRTTTGKQLLKQPLEDTKEIWLPYSKNSFSIHYFAKNKNFSKYLSYVYRLTGLDKDWVFQGGTNFATYTNLSPGKYIFEIKSADRSHEGLTTQLIIHIQSPWYLSWYAFLVYMLIFFTIIFLSFYVFVKRVELKKEREVSDFKLLKEQELTEKKLAFFTSVSHDLKTPLTLIDAPVNDLLQSKNLDKEQINKLQIINRNSKRLYKLITDLLDFRKISQKQFPLEIGEENISDIITNIAEAFKEECKSKNVELKSEVNNHLKGFIDAPKVEKMLWNLLSNALKFTHKGGFISVSAEELIIDGKKTIKLTVHDNGIGISDADKEKIFDRFFKVAKPAIKNEGGTGIGLSIVKELVDIHHGQIEVDSQLNAGTTFTIFLPSEEEFYTTNEIASVKEPDRFFDVEEDGQVVDLKHKQYNLPKILIVEDNSELRDYLAGHFEKSFKVYTAEDGFEGLNSAKQMNPDLILTDVQMPNMNGYEFCKHIRNNFDTSHIPVVMLTANNTIEDQIEGISTGADAYITKPFDIKLLDTVLNSQLDNRKKLRNKFIGIETTENIEKTLPQRDIDFMFELTHFIEENMMNRDLNVDLLTKHFSISLAQLHRKVKSLSGSTPNNLIKSIRLKAAYKLIREDGCRVSEAAYQTGFSDPNYFTTCFKKEFGENPSQV